MISPLIQEGTPVKYTLNAENIPDHMQLAMCGYFGSRL